MPAKTNAVSLLTPHTDTNKNLVWVTPTQSWANPSSATLIASNATGTVIVAQDRTATRGGYGVLLRTDKTVSFSDKAKDEFRAHPSYKENSASSALYDTIFLRESDRRSAFNYGSKREALAAAEVEAVRVGDAADPFAVVLDGSVNPEIQEAIAKAVKNRDAKAAAYDEEARTSWAQDSIQSEYVGTLSRCLPKIDGVNERLLLSAVLDDRIVWTTPPVPVSPTVVTVVNVKTGAVSERYLPKTEAILGEVIGDERVEFHGTALDFLLEQRLNYQQHTLSTFGGYRDSALDALRSLAARVQKTIEEVEGGRTYIDRIPLHLGQSYEEACSNLSRYSQVASECSRLDVPEHLIEGVAKGTLASARNWSGKRGQAYIGDAVKEIKR